MAIFCRKTDNKLTTRIGGEGVAELSPLDPIIDPCPDKNFHNCDFGRKFEKTQGLDDALRRWLGVEMEVLAEMTPLEDTIAEKMAENWWIFAIICILLVLKVLKLFKK